MEVKKIDEYNKELEQAMNRVKSYLSEAQVAMGVVESFLYLSRKELVQTVEQTPNSKGFSKGK